MDSSTDNFVKNKFVVWVPIKENIRSWVKVDASCQRSRKLGGAQDVVVTSVGVGDGKGGCHRSHKEDNIVIGVRHLNCKISEKIPNLWSIKFTMRKKILQERNTGS